MKSNFGIALSGLLLTVFLFVTSGSAAAQKICSQSYPSVCVTTWQQDNRVDICAGCAYRTGQNLFEHIITYSTIGSDNFGQLCEAQLDGPVYGQPLGATGVPIAGTTYAQVVYVVTENDSVYAIDGTNCRQLLHANLLLNNYQGQPAMSPVDCHTVVNGGVCGTIYPTFGITGTPVIALASDGSAGTLYVVAEMQSGSGNNITYYHFLHALDITTLNEGFGNERFGAPIWICNTSQCGSYPSSSAFSQAHIQRPGLLFAPSALTGFSDDYIYVAFSMMDGYQVPKFPNGVLLGYDATNLSDQAPSRLYFQSSAGSGSLLSNGGGIWMSGEAPAFGPDGSGKYWIYVTTANGTYDGHSNWGDSYLKLGPTLLSPDTSGNSFTPADQYYRSAWTNGSPACVNSNGDIDFGPGGPMLIPDNELSSWPVLAVSGDKEGGLWFVDRSQNGTSHNSGCDPQNNSSPCSCTENNYPDPNVQTYWTVGTSMQPGYDTVRGGLAFWENGSTEQAYIYAAPYPGPGSTKGTLTQYPLCASSRSPIDPGSCGISPLSSSVQFKTGATPTVTAASSTDTDAIVWAIGGPGIDASVANNGVLYAFDAVSMHQLYSSSSSGCQGDAIGSATKFSVPTVANGYVYLGTARNDASGTPSLGALYIFGPNRTC